MTNLLSIFTLSFLLIACQESKPITEEERTIDETEGSNEQENENHNETEPEEEEIEEEEPAFSPTDGVWTVIEASVIDDGCGLEDFLDRGQPGSTLDLANGSGSDFTMLFSGGGENIECFLSEEVNYNCITNRQVDDRAADYGLNAPIIADMTTTGFFRTETSMYMENNLQLTCDGPDCGTVSLFLGTSFPCTMILASETSQ